MSGALSAVPYTLQENDNPRQYGASALALAFAVGCIAAFGVTLTVLPTNAGATQAPLPSVLEGGVAPTPAVEIGTPFHKFAIDMVTPVSLQLERGTCWVFAAVSIMEYTYRKQGVANGWLKPGEYLRLSQQAFGIAVLDACATITNASCSIGSREIWHDNQLVPQNTEGGEQAALSTVGGRMPPTLMMMRPALM